MTRSAINKAAKTYAGLDVSLKETAICVVDDAGRIVFERSAATDPQVIAKYLATLIDACTREALKPESNEIGEAEYDGLRAECQAFVRDGGAGSVTIYRRFGPYPPLR